MRPRVLPEWASSAGLTICHGVPWADGNFAKDLRQQAKAFSDATPLRDSDLIFWGLGKAAELTRIKKLIGPLACAGALWIVYPKGRQEIRELQVLEAGRAAGLVDIKVVSFSADATPR